MKIKAVTQTDAPTPQFVVVEAETAEERMLLRLFATWKEYAKDEWEFKLHGYVVTCGVDGVGSFNFGWSKKEENKQKPIGFRL